MPKAAAAATGAGAGAASSAASSTTASSCMTTLHAGIVAGQMRSAGALKAVFARTRASMASETVGRESLRDTIEDLEWPGAIGLISRPRVRNSRRRADSAETLSVPQRGHSRRLRGLGWEVLVTTLFSR